MIWLSCDEWRLILEFGLKSSYIGPICIVRLDLKCLHVTGSGVLSCPVAIFTCLS